MTKIKERKWGGGQNPSKEKRGGDEYYTAPYLVEHIAKRYKYLFDEYDKIYMPFDSEKRDMGKIMKEYYQDKIIFTPDKYYNEAIGCNDFFMAINDKEFIDTLPVKTLIYDNPPFSKMTQILDTIKPKEHLFGKERGFDYLLFGDGLTGLNKLKRTDFSGYFILGRLWFIYLEKYKKDPAVNIALFSNKFNKIQADFFDYGLRRNNRKLPFTDTINIEKLKELCEKGISSAQLVNYTQRGLIFDSKKFYDNIRGKFGGAYKYPFSDLENQIKNL